MKKLILSIAVLTGLALTSQAQTEKGKWMLGGSVSFESSKSDASNAKAVQNFSIVPSIGYFISDNIAIGTGLGYDQTNIGVASGPGNVGQTQAFVVSPFGRYYVPVAEKFSFFGQAAIPLGFGSTKETDADGKAGDKLGSSTAMGIAISPGFAFFPSKKIGIEFAITGLSYSNMRVEDKNGNEVKGAGNDTFSIGADFFAPKIGIQFHF